MSSCQGRTELYHASFQQTFVALELCTPLRQRLPYVTNVISQFSLLSREQHRCRITLLDCRVKHHVKIGVLIFLGCLSLNSRTSPIANRRLSRTYTREKKNKIKMKLKIVLLIAQCVGLRVP